MAGFLPLIDLNAGDFRLKKGQGIQPNAVALWIMIDVGKLIVCNMLPWSSDAPWLGFAQQLVKEWGRHW